MTDIYVKIKYDGYRVEVLTDYADSELVKLCCREQMVEDASCHRVHSSVEAKVYRMDFLGGQYYHKTFCQRSKIEPLKNYFYGSRAKRGLRGHRILRENGFRAPKVIMIGHRGGHNFMVTEAVADAVNLYQYVDDIGKLEAGQERLAKQAIIEELGHYIGRLHAKKIIHGDLRWGNLLITKDQTGANMFWLIDNERTFRYPVLPGVRRLKNLVQLNMTVTKVISRADRMRFFRIYLLENDSIAPDKKQWLRRVADKTAMRLERKRKKTQDTRQKA
ncbi:MAG: hypothetical protein JEZ07_10870 [Phycisphaerae bacterium]|nr:hypothetical protein [Phycisphaerae bacterium]